MNTLMGWNQAQWDEVAEKHLRITRMNPILHESIVAAMKGSARELLPYMELQAWWRSKYDREPNGITRVKLDGGSKVSGQRINFGFDCKIISKGWMDDPMTMGRVFELRVRVGDATFGSRQVMSPHNFMYAHDTQFAEYVERKAIEDIKREIVDKLFPNL